MVKKLVAQFHTREAAEAWKALMSNSDKLVVLKAYNHPWEDAWMVFRVES